MPTENWALLISFLALAVSIGIPIWQRSVNSRDVARNQRTLLLQTILNAKSIAYNSFHELHATLDRYGSKMNDDQKANLAAMVPRLRQHAADIEELHRAWLNYDDGATVDDIERQMAVVNVILSEAEDTARLLEGGRNSYVDT